MNDLRNPYIAGAPVVETSMFFGREDVFNWIDNSLTGKYVDHILVLHGQRRVGKTTVLKQIPNFLSKEYIQVFFDLQGRTNTTLDRFLWWMASEIVRSLNKQLGTDIPRPKRDQFSDSDTFITEFIPDLQPKLNDHTLLLTFDEFDTLSRADIQDKLARPLINFLRRLFEIEGLNFIFSIGSSGNKLENMQAAYTDFFKTALYRKVSFLTQADCYNLITKPVSGIITYQPKAIQRIIEITSGHPYFTQLTCHELFSRCQTNGSRTVTFEDVNDILEDVIERGTVNLKFVWDEASDLEKWILAVLGKEEGIPQKKIGQILQSQGVRFSDSDLNSAILHLRDKDVLTRDNHLVIHLMKQWLEINRPMDRVREELVQTNPIADRYIEIGDELRDRNQLKQAIDSYQQALEFQDNNITALLNIADIHLDQGDLSQACAFYEKALQVDSDHIATRQGFCQAQLAQGNQARKEGDIKGAIEAYQAILFITPVHSQARQNLSDIYQEQAESYLASGDDTRGLEHLRLAIEMTPEDQTLKDRHRQIINEKKSALVNSWLDKADRAIKRKRWDEASTMAEEALKVDPQDLDLQTRVARIKDAPRLEKIKSYRLEAETAIQKGDYNKAIAALKTATMLAPEDVELRNWLEETQTDQQNAQLRLYQTRAEEAQTAGDWDAAVSARKAALKLNPDNESLIQALEETKTAQKQAKLESLEKEVETAQLEKRWQDGIHAANSLIALQPTDKLAKNLLQELQEAQRQSKLAELLQKGDLAASQEQWKEAVSSWESYLEEVPGEAEKFEQKLSQARKYAKLSADYQEAQALINRKQFNKAIPLLQGIIAKDPTYKSTSRLLVEAVEARAQKKPIWRKPWLYAGATTVLLIVFGFLFSDRIFAIFKPSSTGLQPGVSQANGTSEISEPESAAATDNSTMLISENQAQIPDDYRSAIFRFIEEQPPTFANDFSRFNSDWTARIGSLSDKVSVSTFEFVENEQLVIPATYEEFKLLLPEDAGNFALSFTFQPEDAFGNLTFNFREELETNLIYRFKISNTLSNKSLYGLTKSVSSLKFGFANLNSGELETLSSATKHEIIMIVEEEKLIVFFNDQLLIHMDNLDLLGDKNYFTFNSDIEQGTILVLDDIRYWNLEEHQIDPTRKIEHIGLLSSVHNYMETIPSSFEDDFSTEKPEWEVSESGNETQSVNNFIQDGKLDPQDTRLIITNPTISANDFIYKFDFFTSLSRDADFLFRILVDDDKTKYISISVSVGTSNRVWTVSKVGPTQEENAVLAQGDTVQGGTSPIMIINYQDELYVSIRDEVLGPFDTQGFSGTDSIMEIQEGQTIDNFKFWNLEGENINSGDEFGGEMTATPQEATPEEPFSNIQAFMDSTAPTFEDDFTNFKTEWGSGYSDEIGEFTILRTEESGVLEFPAYLGNFTFPTNDIFEAEDFILSFEMSPQEVFQNFSYIFRQTENNPYDTNSRFSPTGYEFSVGVDTFSDGFYTNINRWGAVGAYDYMGVDLKYLFSTKFYKFTILAKGNTLLIFLDGELLFDVTENAPSAGPYNRFIVFGNSEVGDIIHFDNFQFWNLEGLEIDL